MDLPKYVRVMQEVVNTVPIVAVIPDDLIGLAGNAVHHAILTGGSSRTCRNISNVLL
jgi:hypothetical protein